MGDPLTLASLGLSAISTGQSLFPGNTKAYDSVVMVNVNDPNTTTDGGTYSRMTAAEKKAWVTQETWDVMQQEKAQKSQLDTELNKIDSTNIDEELNNYEKDLFKSFMDTASPEVRQWAYERGVAGGTPDQDMMAKTIAEGTKQASLGKFAVQNQFETQKANAKNTAISKYNSTKGGTTLTSPTTTNTPTADWANVLKGLSTDLTNYGIYDNLFKNNKTSGKDELSFDKLDLKDPLANFNIELGRGL